MMSKISEHFDSAEFACPDCGEAPMSPRLIAKLEELRAKIGRSIRVTSGYRCPAHNASIGGAARNSQHMDGTAADIAADMPYSDLLAACNEVFIDGGVGSYTPRGTATSMLMFAAITRDGRHKQNSPRPAALRAESVL